MRFSCDPSSQGVLLDESGALLIKPCLPKEIAFYQSATEHPEFAKWMPMFMGTLQLNGDVNQVVEQAGTPPVLGAENACAAAAPKKSLESSIVLSNLTYGFKK